MATEPAKISAKSYIVYDTLTGRALFEGNADERRLIASVTKLLTAVTALQMADLDDVVTVSHAAAHVEGSSMYAKPGEALTVRTLLYGLMLESGNDAALALAEHCGKGDVRVFVDAMNAMAEKIGMKDSHFENPHGLDAEGQYSTARDLAILAAWALENETLQKIVSTRTYRAEGHAMQNHNKLLWMIEGAEGVKTGFTRAAGRCLVSSVRREGRRIIVVTLSAPDDWRDHKTLYDLAFDTMAPRAYLTEGEIVAELRVQSGLRSSVAVRAPGDIHAALTDAEYTRAEYTVHLPPFVYAPAEAGSAVGYASLMLDGRELARVNLIYETDVGRVRPVLTLWERVVGWIRGVFGV